MFLLASQALLGVQAVALPGVTIGQGATLGAMSCAALNSTLQPGMVHMGSPAKPLLRAAPKTAEGDIPDTLPTRTLVGLLPAVQLLGSCTVAAVSLLPAAALALLASRFSVSGGLDLITAALITAMAACGLTWSGALLKAALLGRLEPAAGIRKYSRQNVLRMLFWTLDTTVDQIFGQAARGSAWWNKALQARGAEVGKRVYIDTLWAGDYELVSYATGAVVDRGATVFAHLGMYKAGQLSISQEPVTIGANSRVAARAAVLPGFSLNDGQELGPGKLGMPMKL